MFDIEEITDLFCFPVQNYLLNKNYEISDSDVAIAQNLTGVFDSDIDYLRKLIKTPKNTIKYLSLVLHRCFDSDFDFLIDVDSHEKIINIICFSADAVKQLNNCNLENIINSNVPFGYKFGTLIERTKIQTFNIDIYFDEHIRSYDE